MTLFPPPSPPQQEPKSMSIETIARVLIVDKESEKVLFCCPKDRSYYYLPGGHVEFSEPMHFAIARELWEEMGLEASREKFSFLGASENIFAQGGEQHHEINIFFTIDNLEFSSRQEIISHEEGIEFLWVSFSDFAGIPILPKSLMEMINGWVKRGKPAIVWHDQ